jgi:hypothetical protein
VVTRIEASIITTRAIFGPNADWQLSVDVIVEAPSRLNEPVCQERPNLLDTKVYEIRLNTS